MNSVEVDAANANVEADVKTKVKELPETGELMTIVDETPKNTSEVKDELKQEENCETTMADTVESDEGNMMKEIGEKEKQKLSDPVKSEECTLDEEPQEGVTETEANMSNISASWRDSSTNYEDFEEEDDEEGLSDEEDYEEDYEDEEAAEEWLTRYYLRQRGLPEALANLPSTIKISVVPETEEDKQRREEKQREELARRKEEYRKKMAQQNNQSQEKGKRKFGMRMTLEEAVRDDFESGQDYVDFLNSKLQNVSIKVSR